MRTRTSNRSKRFTVEKYEFESGSDEAEPARRRKSADQRDADFDGGTEEDEDEGDEDGYEDEDGGEDGDRGKDGGRDEDEDEEDDEDEGIAGADSDAHASDAGADADKPSRQRPKPSVLPASYRDIEPVPPDSHAVKSYVGPYGRGVRGQTLIRLWYGPHRQSIRLAQRLLDLWIRWAVLPPKLPPAAAPLAARGPWSPGFFESEARLAERWRARLTDGGAGAHAQSRMLSAEEARPYQLPPRPLPVLMGPYPAQRTMHFQPGDAHALSQAWIPFGDDENEAKVPTGWMLDAGGIVVGMDWAPRRAEQATQLLALAVVPHADQEYYDFEVEHQRPGFQKHGVVQLWAFRGDSLDAGIARPSAQPARLLKTLCLDYGRARRVRWSPARGHLAILCGDGRVCIVEVEGEADGEETEETEAAYEHMQRPLASLMLSDEAGVKATAMAWASFNRLVVGYSDGSVALWSVHPTRLLARHPVHHSDVVDVATGYPTLPYLVASTPVGGCAKLVDVRSPSCETTEVQINAVNWQPNLLAWSDHILGFFAAYPSANALNTMVGFMHHRHFPLVRRVFTSECFLACLAVGRTHPYLLIGATDGSLWCLNPQCELFKARRPLSDRIRILQHEHRPPELAPGESPARGAARVMHGFGVDKNRHFVAEAKAAAAKGSKSRKKADYEADDEAEDGPASLVDPARGVLHEFLSRVTAVEWNPNQGYGCWAAAAMASGLVRVVDLGLENAREG